MWRRPTGVAAVLVASGSLSRIDAISKLFLTGGGEPRKRLMTKALGDKHADALALLARAQDGFVGSARGALQAAAARRDDGAAAARQGGDAALRRGQGAARGARLRRPRAQAANLLGASAAVEWVLYKLDGGLDHILVDEAQDTSPAQWKVIRALAEEFFAGAARARWRARCSRSATRSNRSTASRARRRHVRRDRPRLRRARSPRRHCRGAAFRSPCRSGRWSRCCTAVDRIFAEPARTPGADRRPPTPSGISPTAPAMPA